MNEQVLPFCSSDVFAFSVLTRVCIPYSYDDNQVWLFRCNLSIIHVVRFFMLLIWDMFKFLFQIVAVSIIQWLASFVFLFFFVLTRFNYFFAAKSKIFTNLFTATSTSKCLKSVLTKSEISPSRSHSQDCRANRNFSLGSRDHLNCLRRVTSSCLLSEGEFDGLS